MKQTINQKDSFKAYSYSNCFYNNDVTKIELDDIPFVTNFFLLLF